MAQQIGGLLDTDRPAEKVTLGLLTIRLGQEAAMSGRLHAFGDDLDLKVMGKRDRGAHHHGVARLGGYTGKQLLRDLQAGHRVGGEVIERGISGAKIVERDPEAELTQLPERVAMLPSACAKSDGALN